MPGQARHDDSCDKPPQRSSPPGVLPPHIRRDHPCPFPTTRSSSSPTAARCCSSAIKATRTRSTCEPKRMISVKIARTATSRRMRPGGTHQSAGYGRSTYEETDFHQQEEDRWIKEAADELKKRALRNDFEALGDRRSAQSARRASQGTPQGGREAHRLHRQQGDERPSGARHRGAARRPHAGGGTTRALAAAG